MLAIAGVLDDDVGDHVRRRLTGVERALEPVVDVLPADHHQRVDPIVAEEGCEPFAVDPVALVLEPLELDQRRWTPVKVLRLSHAIESCSAAETMSAVCWTACFVGSSMP